MDAKDEILDILERRPIDDETEWPLKDDRRFGNPVEMCACGHSRGFHGNEADGNVGHGPCSADDGGYGWIDFPCGCRKFVLHE